MKREAKMMEDPDRRRSRLFLRLLGGLWCIDGVVYMVLTQLSLTSSNLDAYRIPLATSLSSFAVGLLCILLMYLGVYFGLAMLALRVFLMALKLLVIFKVFKVEGASPFIGFQIFKLIWILLLLFLSFKVLQLRSLWKRGPRTDREHPDGFSSTPTEEASNSWADVWADPDPSG